MASSSSATLAKLQRIADDCGFGNTERLRRSFQRLLGRPPGAFRRPVEPEADH